MQVRLFLWPLFFFFSTNTETKALHGFPSPQASLHESMPCISVPTFLRIQGIAGFESHCSSKSSFCLQLLLTNWDSWSTDFSRIKPSRILQACQSLLWKDPNFLFIKLIDNKCSRLVLWWIHSRKFHSFSTLWNLAERYSCLRIFQVLQLKSTGISGVFKHSFDGILEMGLLFQGTNQIYSLQMAFTTCSTTSRSVIERRCGNHS